MPRAGYLQPCRQPGSEAGLGDQTSRAPRRRWRRVSCGDGEGSPRRRPSLLGGSEHWRHEKPPPSTPSISGEQLHVYPRPSCLFSRGNETQWMTPWPLCPFIRSARGRWMWRGKPSAQRRPLGAGCREHIPTPLPEAAPPTPQPRGEVLLGPTVPTQGCVCRTSSPPSQPSSVKSGGSPLQEELQSLEARAALTGQAASQRRLPSAKPSHLPFATGHLMTLLTACPQAGPHVSQVDVGT